MLSFTKSDAALEPVQIKNSAPRKKIRSRAGTPLGVREVSGPTLFLMYVPGLTKNVVSLEWGSHREEFQLSRVISREISTNYPSEVVERKDPILEKSTSFFFPSPTIYALTDSVFSPRTGRIFVNGFPLKESLHWSEGTVPIMDLSRYFPRLLKVSVNSTALAISSNYYHFLIEELPRLILLRDVAGVETVYSRAGIPKFARDALAHFGFKHVPVSVPTQLSEIFFCGPIGASGVPTRLAVQLLNPNSGEAHPTKALQNLKIYISRRNSSRALPIEEKLEITLKEMGFQILKLEEYSFADQLKTFSRARTVVAPHGAGLANTVFMARESKVVEIMSIDYANPCFEVLAKAAELSYHRVLIDPKSILTQRAQARLRAGILNIH